MNASFGRPTQVHSVPPEERAFDSKGNRLPWALEWHEDHPNSGSQRRHIDEKGPFGKSTRRKASSRTRTATPAKRENPNLEGFDRALKFDATRDVQGQSASSSSRFQGDGTKVPQHPIPAEKHPTQVLIFGYPSESQWAALEMFEKVSNGIICEDYEREPPTPKRYPASFSSSRSRRALTKAEREMAFRYHGGHHWIKVTFDSAEAAERAIEASPAQIYNHWVYAQLYYGNGPDRDEAIPIQRNEDGQALRVHKPHSLGSTFSQRPIRQQDHEAPPPQAPGSYSHNRAAPSNDTSPSSTTATSATATAPESSDLRQRRSSQAQTETHTLSNSHTSPMMRHFPDIPRTVLRPAAEAFLPQPTWWERQAKWLAELGVMPGEIIGNGIPRTDDGKLDIERASLYWRLFYWIDSHFGTDFCGLQDDGD